MESGRGSKGPVKLFSGFEGTDIAKSLSRARVVFFLPSARLHSLCTFGFMPHLLRFPLCFWSSLVVLPESRLCLLK